LKLSNQKIEEIYKGVHNLESVMTVKTADEIRALFNEHFHLRGVNETPSPSPAVKDTNTKVPEFRSFSIINTKAPEKQTEVKAAPVIEDENEITDDIIQDLLRDL